MKCIKREALMQTESHTSRLENIAPLENVELIARTSASVAVIVTGLPVIGYALFPVLS